MDCLGAVHYPSIYNEISELRFVDLFNCTLKALVRVSLRCSSHGFIAHPVDQRHYIRKLTWQRCPNVGEL
jgi:hypothetical protein